MLEQTHMVYAPVPNFVSKNPEFAVFGLWRFEVSPVGDDLRK